MPTERDARQSLAAVMDYVGLILPGQYQGNSLFANMGVNYNWNRYFAQGGPMYLAPDAMLAD